MNVTMAELPFRMRTAEPLSDKDLERLSSVQDALHIEREPDGELTVRPVGGTRAGGVGVEVLMHLHAWNENSKAGKLYPNVGCFLPDGSMRGARISWVSNAKWATSAKADDGFLPFCPELVVEVFSHVNYKLSELQQRMRDWVANGARDAWMVDPERHIVEIYRPDREVEICEGDLLGTESTPGLRLKVDEFWR